MSWPKRGTHSILPKTLKVAALGAGGSEVLDHVQGQKAAMPGSGGSLWGPLLEANISLRGKVCPTVGHMKMSGNWEAEACVILKGPQMILET